MANKSRLQSSPPRKPLRIGRSLVLFLLLLLVATVAFGAVVLFESEKPLVTLKTDVHYIGSTADIPFSAADKKSGLRSVVVTLEQDGDSHELFRQVYARQKWMYGAGPAQSDGSAVLDVKKAKLKDGEAQLVITAHDFSLNNMFMGNETVASYPVIIDTKAPRVIQQHAQRYIRPGGSGIVVYDLSEPAPVHGAVVNGQFFPGYPLRDRENRYIAYIALAWDTKALEGSSIIARDKAGNEGNAVFSMVLKNVQDKIDRINVSDGFLNSKIPEFEQHYPEMNGSMLDKYLFVNNDVRQRNADTIKEICSKPEQQQLWQDRFLRMAGQTMAGYAEERSYYYQGDAVDRQVHLGIDIASTASAEIRAANRGKVVFADYLGIYGNMVVLDHGQGVFSLYSHLSTIDTAAGEIVDQGSLIAHSGATGMAGGDHLHFSMLIHGIFVTPIEWWDQHWIDVNIKDITSQL